jgi:hypothetical protein
MTPDVTQGDWRGLRAPNLLASTHSVQMERMDLQLLSASISQVGLLAPIVVVPMCLRKRKPWFWPAALCGVVAFGFQWKRVAAGGELLGAPWSIGMFLVLPIVIGWGYARFMRRFWENWEDEQREAERDINERARAAGYDV